MAEMGSTSTLSYHFSELRTLSKEGWWMVETLAKSFIQLRNLLSY
jgi:hypothetical protein